MGTNIKTAWRAYAQGDTERALAEFAKATQNEAASAYPLIQEGLLYLKLARPVDAVQSFQRGHQLAPENPAPLFFLAIAQELSDNDNSSPHTLQQLRTLSPHHQGLASLELLQELRTGNPLKLLGEFGFGPTQDDQKTASLAQKVAASLGRGDPSVLASELSSSDYLLGPILIEVETRLHPLEIPQLEHHAPLLDADLDKVKPLKRSLREELSGVRNSLKAGPHLKRGKSLLEKTFGVTELKAQHELLREAALKLRTARKLDPYAFRVSYHLCETYLSLSKLGPGKPHDRFRLLQAQAAILESSRKEGINPYLLFYLAYTQHLLGRPHLAIEYYQAATKRFEKLPEAHYGEGQCHLLLGNRAKAMNLILKAVNSDLALARERLDLFANILADRGLDHFARPIPLLAEKVSGSATPLEELEPEQ